MSNKAVPPTYRAIIDKVIASVRPDFEDNGIEDAVLQALQESWEAKLALSRVADFSSDPRLGAYQSMLPPLPEASTSTAVTKDSPKDEGSASNANGSSSNNEDKDVKPDVSGQAGESSTSTSKGQASGSTATESKSKAVKNSDSNSIGSDLDESDEDLLSDDDLNEDPDDPMSGMAQEGDIIIALWEKVQRVKNRWKITLKDGVISAKGKDWVFSKCQGDFEW